METRKSKPLSRRAPAGPIAAQRDHFDRNEDGVLRELKGSVEAIPNLVEFEDYYMLDIVYPWHC